ALAASVAAVRVRQKLGPVVAPALLARAVAVALPLGVVAWWIPAEGPALLLELTALGALYLAALFGLGLARREDVALLFPRRG
ncbi:MAG: hypothetical protein ACRELC_04470, partial [Gemmatimonadota bacterium]